MGSWSENCKLYKFLGPGKKYPTIIDRLKFVINYEELVYFVGAQPF